MLMLHGVGGDKRDRSPCLSDTSKQRKAQRAENSNEILKLVHRNSQYLW